MIMITFVILYSLCEHVKELQLSGIVLSVRNFNVDTVLVLKKINIILRIRTMLLLMSNLFFQDSQARNSKLNKFTT